VSNGTKVKRQINEYLGFRKLMDVSRNEVMLVQADIIDHHLVDDTLRSISNTEGRF
jgi:hypothetical protein